MPLKHSRKKIAKRYPKTGRRNIRLTSSVIRGKGRRSGIGVYDASTCIMQPTPKGKRGSRFGRHKCGVGHGGSPTSALKNSLKDLAKKLGSRHAIGP